MTAIAITRMVVMVNAAAMMVGGGIAGAFARSGLAVLAGAPLMLVPGRFAVTGMPTGGTSMPTGMTLPSVANPQVRSFSAEAISVSAGQCRRVTTSVTPLRRAKPT
jgi:hypothetical protein